MGDVMDLGVQGRLRLEHIFSHRLPLVDGSQAYRLFAARQAMKVLLVL